MAAISANTAANAAAANDNKNNANKAGGVSGNSNKDLLMRDKSTSTINDNQQQTPRSSASTTSSSKQGLSPAAAAANYAKQVKYGIYERPGAPIVGVPSKSSGTAANLATSSDLSLKLWQYDKASSAAGTAALLANDSTPSPAPWKPDTSSNAASAALLAKDKNDVNSEERNRPSMVAVNAPQNASKAALSAHDTPGRDMAAKALPDAYSWREREESKTQLSRSASNKVFRKDSTASSHYSESHPNDGRRRSSSMNSNNYGIDPNSLQNISGLESRARQNVEQRLSKLYLSSSSGQQLKISNTGSEAAAHALASSKDDHDSRYLKERETFLQDEIKKHESIMNFARERAAGSLAKIDQQVTERNPLHEAGGAMNKEAVEIAEKNLRSRLENHGKIDIGGGKYMTQTEIEDIAQKNVKPVLAEISEKASEQRQADEERRQHEEENRMRTAEEKRIGRERKAEDKRLRKEELAKQKAVQNQEKSEAKKLKGEQKAENKKLKDAQKAENKKNKSEKKAEVKERRQRIARDRRELVEQKIREKIHSKKLWSDAQHATDAAKADVAKTAALKDAKEAQLEKAQIAADQADSDQVDVDKARQEVAQKKAELAEAEKAHEEAQLKLDEKVKATEKAESTHMVQEQEEQQARQDAEAAAVEEEAESSDEESDDDDGASTSSSSSSSDGKKKPKQEEKPPADETGIDSNVALPVITTDNTVMDADHDKAKVDEGGLDSTVALPVISTDNTVVHSKDKTQSKKGAGKQQEPVVEDKEEEELYEQPPTVAPVTSGGETNEQSSPKKKLTGWMGNWKTRLNRSSSNDTNTANNKESGSSSSTGHHYVHVPGKISSSLNKIGNKATGNNATSSNTTTTKQPLPTASDNIRTSNLAVSAATAVTNNKEQNKEDKQPTTYPEQELPEIEVERTFSGFSGEGSVEATPADEVIENKPKKTEGVFQEEIS